jgi:hypothetical protein
MKILLNMQSPKRKGKEKQVSRLKPTGDSDIAVIRQRIQK